MELMRDWLGPTIELQLQGALRWKEQGPLAYQAFGGVAYEDDGSNLRIMLKKAGHLQIVKVSPALARAGASCLADNSVRKTRKPYYGGSLGLAQLHTGHLRIQRRQSLHHQTSKKDHGSDPGWYHCDCGV